jgi:tetratricopeptide (TPR) repeat protein
MLHSPSGRFLFILTVCCLLAVPAFAGAALSVTPDLPENGARAERVLSARDALFLAKSLLEQDKPDEAEKVYDALASNQNEDIRIEAVFQLAHIRLRQGKIRQAISLFHEILNRRPDLTRVRLDLARAYFLDKNYEDATFQFELVKGGDLPPEVLANVDMFLDAIRRQKNWTVDFSLSPVSDSNINQASGGREECIDTVFGTLCRPLEEKSSGMGLNVSATVDHFRRFHQDWGLRSTVGFYGTAYEEDEFNDYILYAATGPRYLWESGEASLQPTFRRRWIGEKEYSEEYGLRLDARQIYGRLLLSAGAAFASAGYADGYVHSVLKGQSWNAYLQPRYILTDRTFIQAGLDFLREETKIRAYGNDNWRYSLGVYHVFPYGVSLFVEGSLMRTRYQAPQWYVTRDNRIDVTTRKDQTWRFLTSLSSNVFEKYSLTPLLQYSYTRRDSNIWTREYDRHRLNLLINYRF